MSSRFGKTIQRARLARGLSLRQLAKAIGKSPSYLVALEHTTAFPGSTDETLRALAEALELDPDLLFSSINRTPAELQPENPTELALHRIIKAMREDQQAALLAKLTEQQGDGCKQ